jgi:hypothetical protein
MRTLVTGKKVKELKKPKSWTFESKCPAKWVHIDCESGHVFVKSKNGTSWLMPTIDQIDAAIKSLKSEKKYLGRGTT